MKSVNYFWKYKYNLTLEHPRHQGGVPQVQDVHKERGDVGDGFRCVDAGVAEQQPHHDGAHDVEKEFQVGYGLELIEENV